MVQKVAPAARRAYSSEMANALVQVSQNIGMGNAAIGLGGAGVSTLSHIMLWCFGTQPFCFHPTSNDMTLPQINFSS